MRRYFIDRFGVLDTYNGRCWAVGDLIHQKDQVFLIHSLKIDFLHHVHLDLLNTSTSKLYNLNISNDTINDFMCDKVHLCPSPRCEKILEIW